MIRLIIADDHQMFIDGVKSLLKSDREISVIGEAFNGKQLMALLSRETPDVVLLDIRMPEMDGLEAAHRIRQQYPKVKLLVLTMHNIKIYIREMMHLGVDGYLMKNSGRHELVTAIHSVCLGKCFYDKAVLEFAAENMKPPSYRHSWVETDLTEKEKELIVLICEEHTSKEIGVIQNKSEESIETYRKNLLSKLQLKSTVGLVKYAIQHGIFELHNSRSGGLPAFRN